DWDAWWASVEGSLDEREVPAVADDASAPAVSPAPRTSSPSGTSDRWSNGILDAILAPRTNAKAVWTGSVMIVWGGGGLDFDCLNYSLGGSYYQDGSRYDPLTDTWSAISRINTLAPRTWFSAVWTGSEMIVWGGLESDGHNVVFNDGGRYDPATD